MNTPCGPAGHGLPAILPSTLPGQAGAKPALAVTSVAPAAPVNPHTPDGLPTSPAWVCAMLEEAGATLLALPQTGYSTRLRAGGLDWMRDAGAVLAPGSGPAPLRPAAPSAAAIDRMDLALAWLALIPDSMFVLRRVAGARALVHPLTGRHLFPWRRLGSALGADHKAVQRWHGQAMARISTALNASGPGRADPPRLRALPRRPAAAVK